MQSGCVSCVCVQMCVFMCERESVLCVCVFCVSQDLDVEDGVEEEVVAGVEGIATSVHVRPQQNAKDTYRIAKRQCPGILT